jgi:hypothetical protein
LQYSATGIISLFSFQHKDPGWNFPNTLSKISPPHKWRQAGFVEGLSVSQVSQLFIMDGINGLQNSESDKKTNTDSGPGQIIYTFQKNFGVRGEGTIRVTREMLTRARFTAIAVVAVSSLAACSAFVAPLAGQQAIPSRGAFHFPGATNLQERYRGLETLERII